MSAPDLVELEAFFECEAALLDEGVDWRYNTLTFQTERAGVEVWCELQPSYATIRAALRTNGVEIARADIASFTALELSSEAGREVLTVRFDENATMWLVLRPEVSLRLAT